MNISEMADQEMIQEKIGEALGLEKAAQKAVKDLDSRGLLESEHVKKLSKMKAEASQQEQEMQDLVQDPCRKRRFFPGDYQRQSRRDSRKSVKDNGNISRRRTGYTRSLRVSMFSRRRRSSAL